MNNVIGGTSVEVTDVWPPDTRPVNFKKSARINGLWTQIDMAGRFHRWAQDNDGEGHDMPVGIVEDDEGNVHCVYAELIKFTDRKDSKPDVIPT